MPIKPLVELEEGLPAQTKLASFFVKIMKISLFYLSWAEIPPLIFKKVNQAGSEPAQPYFFHGSKSQKSAKSSFSDPIFTNFAQIFLRPLP